MNIEDKKDLFRTLSPEEFEAAPVPTPEEIRAALRKFREIMIRPKFGRYPRYI